MWPEAAVPFLLQEDPRRVQIEALAREVGASLLVGAPDVQAGQPRNSAFLLGPAGRLLGRYDKRHLVPFGEYVPLRRLLFFVDPLAGGAIGQFSPGREATVFATPSGRFGVVICYEAIFPEEVRDLFRGGADFLVNIINDAWFGRSAAPVQHLAMAAFRAVENRAFLIRAANTGISAIVAPDGRIVQASELFTTAVLAGAITPRAGGSLYTRYGDLLAWGNVGGALAAVLGLILLHAGHGEAALLAIERALARDPTFPLALWAKGIALFEARQDYAGAIQAWETLMAQHLDPTNADAVAQWIVAARKRLAAQPAEVQQRPEPERTITGTVTLAPQLSPEVPASGALFIIARQGDGPPLAVKRIPNPSFPVRFALGPADRMLADTPFAGEVTLLARLKRDGTAGPPAPGDLEGRVGTAVKVGQQGVDIVLDKAY